MSVAPNLLIAFLRSSKAVLRADEIVELVLDEVNDMLEKNKIKINYEFNDDHNEWDYF